jgi:protocatechuate 3,4-dioxygenase beta subunit
LENNIKISDILEINIVEWGTISGEVLDNNLNGIPNAAITLWNSESVNGGYVIKSIIRIPENPQLSNDGRTSSIGQFIYRRVPLGTYILTAEKNGYKGKAIVNLKNKSIKNNLVLNI